MQRRQGTMDTYLSLLPSPRTPLMSYRHVHAPLSLPIPGTIATRRRDIIDTIDLELLVKRVEVAALSPLFPLHPMYCVWQGETIRTDVRGFFLQEISRIHPHLDTSTLYHPTPNKILMERKKITQHYISNQKRNTRSQYPFSNAATAQRSQRQDT